MEVAEVKSLEAARAELAAQIERERAYLADEEAKLGEAKQRLLEREKNLQADAAALVAADIEQVQHERNTSVASLLSVAGSRNQTWLPMPTPEELAAAMASFGVSDTEVSSVFRCAQACLDRPRAESLLVELYRQRTADTEQAERRAAREQAIEELADQRYAESAANRATADQLEGVGPHRAKTRARSAR